MNAEPGSRRFVAFEGTGQALEELGALSTTNPFATAAYFNARVHMGAAGWILGVRTGTGALEVGCAAFLRRGRLNSELEIPSLPAVSPDHDFWTGLRLFCRKVGVDKLHLDTFGSSPGVEIPAWGVPCSRRVRCEYVLDLSGDPADKLSSNHKRNVKKGIKASLTVKRSNDIASSHAHLALMQQSVSRRVERGEVGIPTGHSDVVALLSSGAGQLFQAVHGEEVLSSILLLRAPTGGYYHSAGTSPSGMAVGASHFLIHSVAQALKSEGASAFNLGGAEHESSLERFKEGFGADRVPLSAASCEVGPAWRRQLSGAFSVARSAPRALKRRLRVRALRIRVYALNTAERPSTPPNANFEFRKLSEAEVKNVGGDVQFQQRQLQRLERFGASYAYAVLDGGHLAHVSWLLPEKAMARDAPRIVRSGPGIAEITACETLPQFRGKGIYGFAILSLLKVASEDGIRRVYMKTTEDNKASQVGIEKAGLQRVGSARIVMLPILRREFILRRFR